MVFFLILLDQGAQVGGRVTFEQLLKQMRMFARVPPLARTKHEQGENEDQAEDKGVEPSTGFPVPDFESGP